MGKAALGERQAQLAKLGHSKSCLPGSRGVENDLTLTKKCTLNNNDLIRETHANLGHYHVVIKKTEQLALDIIDEGSAYHRVAGALKEKAEESKDFSAVKAQGPASAHLLLRMLRHLKIKNADIPESEHAAHAHFLVLESLLTKAEEGTMQELGRMAGTFMTQRSQRSLKIYFLLTMAKEELASVLFLIRRGGHQVYPGKEPLAGMFKALQATLPQRRE